LKLLNRKLILLKTYYFFLKEFAILKILTKPAMIPINKKTIVNKGFVLNILSKNNPINNPMNIETTKFSPIEDNSKRLE
jgi:hypothetical protein